MKNHFMLARALSFLFLTTALTSCVSVKLPISPISRSPKIVTTKPTDPFEEYETNSADAAWSSTATGNTISYLSECKRDDTDLKTIALESVQGIEKTKILKTSSASIAGHKSADLIAVGTIDKQRVKMSVSVFRAEDCTYSLVYGGTEKTFDLEIRIFEEFKKEFKLP